MVDSERQLSSPTDVNNNFEQSTDVNNNKVGSLGSNESIEMVNPIQDQLLNLTPEEMMRGSTPTGIEERCLDLCRAYIGGSWNLASGIEDIIVKRVGGGFTNQLYHVQLTGIDANDDDSSKPSEVAIKFYQAKHMKNYQKDDHERLNDVIISTIVSEMCFGPKVYGIFNDGFIQEYIKVSKEYFDQFLYMLKMNIFFEA